jgi:pyruvate dehydrogenase E2 component (dihydrolipoamide acetyltransferase)
MPIPVSIPRLGWNMEEGIFVEWLKADGGAVRSGDAVFRLEGEKATEDIEVLDSGTLHIPANGPKPGDKLAVGTIIGYLLQPGESVPANEVRTPSPTQVIELPEPENAPGVVLAKERAITPRARRLAARLGVDPAHVRGSGRNGRVRERDVAAAHPSPASSERGVPLAPTRKAIAARMTESRQTTAPVTLTRLVDATNLVNLREQFKAAGREDVPAYTDFLVKLVGVALQKHPLLAARWTDEGIVPPRVSTSVLPWTPRPVCSCR